MKARTKVAAAVISVIVAALLGGMICSADVGSHGTCTGPKLIDDEPMCLCTNTQVCFDKLGCSKKGTIELEERMIAD